jgi:hypothetical protein
MGSPHVNLLVLTILISFAVIGSFALPLMLYRLNRETRRKVREQSHKRPGAEERLPETEIRR